MTWQTFTKTIECSASDHVTLENRARVLDWVLAWGGHGALTPEGAEDLMVLYTDRGEWPVPTGARVVYNGTYFYPSESTFDEGWTPVPISADTCVTATFTTGGSAKAGTAEAGGPSLLDGPTSAA